MLNIPKVSNINPKFILGSQNTNAPSVTNAISYNQGNEDVKTANADNLKAYHPSFMALWGNKKAQAQNEIPQVTTETPVNAGENQAPVDTELQFNMIKAKLDKESVQHLESLKQKGILTDNHSNDGSTVLDNLYKIITEPRIQGLNDSLILAETVKALDNPCSITQKFGDIPDNVADEISQETGEKIPDTAKNVVSSSCVAASMEFNLADRMPAEFTRFVQGLSGENYSVDKNVKMSNIAEGFAEGIWKLREFNTNNQIGNNWEDVSIKLQPDRNAIVRARVQTSYKDPGERSCIDVLIQSAILNFASQCTYDSITDERTGKYNPDNTGLTDFEKNFAEQVIFETPKYSVVYQDLDENGVLQGYNCTLDETKQHILKSLELGQNVIIGYTHMDSNKQVDGGHEITIVGYEQDNNGKGSFICNDTDDELDEPIKISEEKLLPLIHHAGISKEALNSDDVVVDSWREYLAEFKKILEQEKQQAANSAQVA